MRRRKILRRRFLSPMIKKFFSYFTPFEYLLWIGSVLAIVLSFVLCKNTDYLNLFGSILGATALILISKGNVVGEALCVLFAGYYGFVSFGQRYYGEMITYLCMSGPMALAALIAWLRHPFQGRRTEVEIKKLPLWEYGVILLITGAVTAAFYFILRALGTANLIWSTVSVATSFAAVALTFRRSPFYAVAYALNDIVLIVLWSLAVAENSEYIALVVCFSVFLLNDSYGFFNWMRMRKNQSA